MPFDRGAVSDPFLFDSVQQVVKAPPRKSYFTPLGVEKNSKHKSCLDITLSTKREKQGSNNNMGLKNEQSGRNQASGGKRESNPKGGSKPLTKAGSSSTLAEEPKAAPTLGLGVASRDRRASMVFVDFLMDDGVSDVNKFLQNYTPKASEKPETVTETESESETGSETGTDVTASEVTDSEYEREMAKLRENKRPPPKGPNPLMQPPTAPAPAKTVPAPSAQVKSTAAPAPAPAQPEVTGRPPSARNVDDVMFDMYKSGTGEMETLLVGDFLNGLGLAGIRKNDQRLKELFDNLQEEKRAQGQPCESVESLRLDRDGFCRVVADNIVLISRALRQQFILPEFQKFCSKIQDLFYECREINHGIVPSHIPQLARVNPNYWGVAICTVDGQRFSIGDTEVPFTLQSCCKPLTYAIALNEIGADVVHGYVGQEPSGRMFNELVLDYNKKPHNPMVNAGAIIVCSILKSLVQAEMTMAEKFDYTHTYLKRLAGGEYMGFNNSVFLSEREVADRNYALGFYLRENNCFPDGKMLKDCMDYYFQCCSMETNCEAGAVIAATLADGGVCPVTGEKVLNADSVRDVLSLMHSCGMYDYSGQFAFNVGLPAKSGACGAILLVVPNVLGMCLWSPALDIFGNSARGVHLCEELIKVFNFHKYDNMATPTKMDPRKQKTETKGLQIVNLLFAAACGDMSSLKRFHLSGLDMNASDYDGRTALHLAAAEGHRESVEYLLKFCRVNPKPLDRWGNIPRDDAERFNHVSVVKLLRRYEKEYETR